jgi:uncharacterized protein YjbI with pentapeptide repeats
MSARAVSADDGQGFDGVIGADHERHTLKNYVAVRSFLAKSDFRSAVMTGMNLNQADVREAMFDGAAMMRATLTHADLRGASMTHTNLRDADLTFAKLDGADLSEAELEGANLQGSDFRGCRTITPEQVKGARNYKLAFFDQSTLDSLGLARGHNDNLLQRNLAGYDFRDSI